MADARPSIPLNRTAVIDEYFLDHRAKLIDIAAFLDRVDRAKGDGPEDFRMAAFRRALALLDDGETDRARRVLESMSDHSTDLLDSAPGKGACGTQPPGTPDA